MFHSHCFDQNLYRDIFAGFWSPNEQLTDRFLVEPRGASSARLLIGRQSGQGGIVSLIRMLRHNCSHWCSHLERFTRFGIANLGRPFLLRA